MDWLQLLYDVFEVCVIPLLGLLTAYVIKFIQKKSDEIAEKTDSELQEKYIKMLTATITDCVTATTQTYVDSLKAQGAFDAEAQKTAFNLTYEAVVSILSDEAKTYLDNLYGDLTAYIMNKIEAEVKAQK